MYILGIVVVYSICDTNVSNLSFYKRRLFVLQRSVVREPFYHVTSRDRIMPRWLGLPLV